jgi:hypothetical protein
VTDIFERLKKLGGEEGFDLLKGDLVGHDVTVTISGINGFPCDRPCELAPGETLRYWLCISDGRAWYEWSLIPKIDSGPLGLG